jgi:hypothetical protein
VVQPEYEDGISNKSKSAVPRPTKRRRIDHDNEETDTGTTLPKEAPHFPALSLKPQDHMLASQGREAISPKLLRRAKISLGARGLTKFSRYHQGPKCFEGPFFLDIDGIRPIGNT